MAGAPGIGAGRQRRAAAPMPGAYATRRAAPGAGTRRWRERAAEQAGDRERLQRYNRAKADYTNRKRDVRRVMPARETCRASPAATTVITFHSVLHVPDSGNSSAGTRPITRSLPQLLQLLQLLHLPQNFRRSPMSHSFLRHTLL